MKLMQVMHEMDTRLLNLFLEVVRSGSFAAAARNLNQDPSSVSRAIALLEEEMGVRLFQRTTRKIALTEAGTQFAAKIEPVVAELERVKEEVRSDTAQPKGRLCISASVAFGQVCLMPLVPKFLRLYPQVDLELKFTDRNEDLISEHIDLAIRLAPSVDANVIASKLMPTRYRVCATPQYLAQHDPIRQPGDLAQHRSVCFDLPGYRNQWLFKRGKGSVESVAITSGLIASNALALHSAVLSHLGPALLADWLIQDDLQQKTLIDLFSQHQITATTFDTAAWLLYPSRAFLPRKTRVMIDFLRAHMNGAQI